MNDVDRMVLRFNESDDERERNKIFKIIREIYLPKFYYKRNGYARQWYDYLDSEYDLQVLMAMMRWKPDKGTLFTTYLYIYCTVKPFSAVNEKIISKSHREPNWTALGLWDYDDDEY